MPAGASSTTQSAAVRDGMRAIPAGSFLMGSEDVYPAERPVRCVEVGAFSIDERSQTVAEFRRFVKATGYVTVAGVPAHARAGRPARLRQLVACVPSACWSRPEGPASDTCTRGGHPVTQVAYDDAAASARGQRRRCRSRPSGSVRCAAASRARRTPGAASRFLTGARRPIRGRASSRGKAFSPTATRGPSPPGEFPPNGYGLLDVTGNVWEWTCDRFGEAETHATCCGPAAGDGLERRVIKGGSHLCAPSYDRRYGPAARQGGSVDMSTSHIGFRCVVRTE